MKALSNIHRATTPVEVGVTGPVVGRASRTFVPSLTKAAAAVLAVGLCTAVSAGAEDSAAPTFSFSSFGTLRLVHSSEDRADFTSSPFKPTGAGFTRVGMRRDFVRNVDLKLQIDPTRNGAGSAGTLSDLQSSFKPGGTVNLLSAKWYVFVF